MKWLAEMPEPFPLLDDAKAAVERGYDSRAVLARTVEEPDPRDGAW